MSSRFRSPRSQALSTKRASLARTGLGSVDFRAIPPRIKPPLEVVAVQDWPRPKGYVNGAIIRGRTLHVAGQVGWTPEGRFEKKDFSGQFDRALGKLEGAQLLA